MTVDLRRVNQLTKPMFWPLLNIEEVQEHLHGARYFIKIDLKDGYWMILADKTS